MRKAAHAPAIPTESPPEESPVTPIRDHSTHSPHLDIPEELITIANSFGRSCYILGDQRGSKMRILSLIARHRLSVKTISTILHLSESSTSQHLSRLQAHNVIIGERHGHTTIYQLNPDFLDKFTQTFNAVLPISGTSHT